MFKIALKFIFYDKPKSIGALAGTLISVFLIGQQCGIFIFLRNAIVSLVNNNSQYIWVVDDKTTNANALSLLDMRVGQQLASIKGVAKVHPLVVAGGSARFANGKSSGIVLIGSQAPGFAGGPWNLYQGTKASLLQEGAIITEFFSKDDFGGAQMGDYFEVNGKKVFISGQTKGVTSFSGAYTFTTIERARYLGKVSPYKASAFLLEWEPGVPPQQVVARINAAGMGGIRAWTGPDFTEATALTVLLSSGIPFSFGTIIVFAFIFGFVIIGLTLYSAATDRLRDYGTLKAIGATNGYVRRLILTQALIFAVVGFAIGYVLLLGFKKGIANVGTIFEFPLWLEVGFFVSILLIALSGSLFAIRRITKVEPAQVFR